MTATPATGAPAAAPSGPGGVLVPLAFTTTAQTKLAATQLKLASRRLGVEGKPDAVAVFGPPGTGKSEIVARTVQTLYADQGAAVISLTLSADIKPNELATRILAALKAPTVGKGYVLRGDVVDLLRERRSVIVLAEAHHLQPRTWRDTKVVLDDLPQTDWIFIGHPDLLDSLEAVPEVRNRIGTWINVQPLSRHEVLTVLPQAHPLYAAAEPQLLAEVDADHGHGTWRNWSHFTSKAAMTADSLGVTTLNAQVARLALQAVGAPAPTRRRRTR